MPSPVKTAAVAGGALVLLIAGWAAASIQVGRRAEAALRQFTDTPPANASLRAAKLRHSSGLFSSSGEVELHLVNACAEPGAGAAELVALQVQYTLSHLALPTSALRFDWTMQAAGATGTAISQALGPQAQLTGQGQVGYGGDVSSQLRLPALAYSTPDGAQLRVSPSSGRVAWGAQALAVEWNTDDITARGNGQALVVKKLQLAMDLSNRWRGTGTARFGIDQISTSQGSVEGLQFSSTAKDNGDRLDMELRQSVRSANVAGQVAKDLTLALGVTGVHGASVEAISRIVGDSCGLSNITADEQTKLRNAVGALLAQGFSAGITQLSGTVGGGSIDGKFTVALSPGKAGPQAPVSLAAQLQSSGKLLIKGAALTPEQLQMAVAMGAAVQTPAGLEASFDYAGGVFKANGRAYDAGQVQQALAALDGGLNAFLGRSGGASAMARAPAEAPPPAPVAAPPAEAPPAEAPAVATAAPAAPPAVAQPPATAPATAAVAPPVVAPASPATTATAAAPAAAPAECATVQACTVQSLHAAAREDVDALRALAGRIDALPKPDLGNKAQARKLNAEGLAALGRDDTAAAISAFQAGMKENPRDVELAGNLGFAQARAGQAAAAVATLTQALVLDPRRTSTWTPLAEALALAGRPDDALAALWAGWQWSANREKSQAFYADRAQKEGATRPAVAKLYASMTAWVGGGTRPALTLAAR